MMFFCVFVMLFYFRPEQSDECSSRNTVEGLVDIYYFTDVMRLFVIP
jgi:hypothetical protein